jgi:hypothetical protein
MTHRSSIRFLFLTAATTLSMACGSSDDSSGGAGGSGAVDGHSAKLLADSSALRVGKSQLQIELTESPAGTPATGLASAMKLAPLMTMSMMKHGAPVPVDAVTESATPGTYDCTLFFPMASVDASGDPQGSWSLDVGVGDELAGSFDLTVPPAAGPDTTHVTLKNAADAIGSDGMSKPRNWFLFRDSLVAAGAGHTFSVFVATVQEGMMVWPPVTVGLELVDSTGAEQLTVQSLEVSASTDGNDWVPLTCDAKARCSGALEGLKSGASGEIRVKLAVNGTDYTTDGSPPDTNKQNAFATFTVTAP